MTKASGSIDLKSLKIAGEGANKYITAINNDGIKVHDANKQNIDYVQINSNGLTVYQNTAKVAEFGTSIRLGLNEAQVIIGNENGTNQSSHIVIDNGGINIYRESDLVMHLGEHTVIGRDNKSQLDIENGFLQFSSYINAQRIPQFTIGNANTTKATYTPLFLSEIEINTSNWTDNNPDESRWPQGGDFEIFYDSDDPPQPDTYGAITVEDYYIDDPSHYDAGDPTWYASVIKICLGELDQDFDPNNSDLYLGFNGNTIADNYYTNDSSLIDSRPIRWFLYTEGGITYLILSLNFVTRTGTGTSLDPYIYQWNSGGSELTRPNGRFSNISIMLYECNNSDERYSSFTPYLTFGNRTTNSIIGDYSVTFGKNLINDQEGCFVIGKNNVAPSSGDLFVIGTGSSEDNRANSFRIDNNGNLSIKDGFKIINETGNYLHLTNNGLEVYQNVSNTATRVASFGASGAVIGENSDGKSRSEINSNGMQVIRNDNGTDVQIASLGYTLGPDHEGGTSYAPVFTFGTRFPYIDYPLGNYSSTEGIYLVAEGYAAHAEGFASKARGDYSHAEGDYSEGNGEAGHGEGYMSAADGDYSHAQNENTVASKKAQTVLGTFNIEDESQTTTHPSGNAAYGQYAFIIGNGTGPLHFGNAFTVDWAGNVNIPLGAKYKINGVTMSPRDIGAESKIAGVIQMFVGSTPPWGWLICDGSSYLRTSYPKLFAALGGTSSPWGLPDSTHYNVPDLRGRAPIGAGTGSGLTARTLGTQNIGTEDAIVPYHRHASYKYTSNALGSGSTGARIYNPTGSSGDSTMYTSYAGTSGNATGANMQPSAVVNFIICTGE